LLPSVSLISTIVTYQFETMKKNYISEITREKEMSGNEKTLDIIFEMENSNSL
jgi:hypothetical protein